MLRRSIWTLINYVQLIHWVVARKTRLYCTFLLTVGKPCIFVAQTQLDNGIEVVLILVFRERLTCLKNFSGSAKTRYKSFLGSGTPSVVSSVVPCWLDCLPCPTWAFLCRRRLNTCRCLLFNNLIRGKLGTVKDTSERCPYNEGIAYSDTSQKQSIIFFHESYEDLFNKRILTFFNIVGWLVKNVNESVSLNGTGNSKELCNWILITRRTF